MNIILATNTIEKINGWIVKNSIVLWVEFANLLQIFHTRSYTVNTV